MFAGHRYPATGETIEESRLCLFERDAFEASIAANPQLCLGMLGAISFHLHEMVLQIEQLKTRSAEQRLVDFLLGLCKTGTGPCRITLPYDKSLLAARLGMRPESSSRNLAYLSGFGVHARGVEVAIDNAQNLAEDFAGAPLAPASGAGGLKPPVKPAPVGFCPVRKYSLSSFSLNSPCRAASRQESREAIVTGR